MATREPERAAPAGGLTALPRVEDLPVVEQGFDQARVREAFDAFRRHTLQLQAQLRVLQAAGTSTQVEPTGHAVRMDALHLIRAAAEFADQLERDAQTASASQFRRTQEDVRRRQRDAQAREEEVERYRKESETQRAEILGAARTEARELLTKANQEATREMQEAEARVARLLEQSRHQATELTNSARAEVEQTLEWARAQAGTILSRAQQGAQQLLSAAGLGDEALTQVSDAIVRAAEESAESTRPSGVAEPRWDVPPSEGAAQERPALASVPEPEASAAEEGEEPAAEGAAEEPDSGPSDSGPDKPRGKGGRTGGSQN